MMLKAMLIGMHIGMQAKIVDVAQEVLLMEWRFTFDCLARGRGWGRRRMRGPNEGEIDGRKNGGSHVRWEVGGV